MVQRVRRARIDAGHDRERSAKSRPELERLTRHSGGQERLMKAGSPFCAS